MNKKYSYPNFPSDIKVKSQLHFNRYIKFIDSREFRIIPTENYTEKHHIIPVSFNGSNSSSNIIKLTAREHFIAHMILAKAFHSKSMVFALWRMSNFNRYKDIFTSREYNRLRNKYILYKKELDIERRNSQLISKGNKTKYILKIKSIPEGWVKGYSEKTKKEIESKKLLTMKQNKTSRVCREKGKPLSEEIKNKERETRKRNGTTRKGKKWSEETKIKSRTIREQNGTNISKLKGIKLSEEMCNKRKEAYKKNGTKAGRQKGIKISQEEKLSRKNSMKKSGKVHGFIEGTMMGITNGKENKFIPIIESIPYGWRKGCTQKNSINWKLTSPTGECYRSKGSLDILCKSKNIDMLALRAYMGKKVMRTMYTNTIGWQLDKE